MKQLDADCKVAPLTLEECDFRIKFDPKKHIERGGTSHANELLSEVDDFSYLGALANLTDFCAGLDEQSGDPQKVKNARYRRNDAAKIRRFMFKPRTPKGDPTNKSGGSGIPF